MIETLSSLLNPLLEFVGAQGIPITIVLVLFAFLLYSRKALVVGSLVADWTSRVMFAVAAILVLLLLGIISGVDVGRATELVAWVFERASSWLR